MALFLADALMFVMAGGGWRGGRSSSGCICPSLLPVLYREHLTLTVQLTLGGVVVGVLAWWAWRRRPPVDTNG